MGDESQETLMVIQDVLGKLLSGEQCNTMEIHPPVPELQNLVVQINQLIQNLNEMNRLAIDLSEGKLDEHIPSRHNFMAGPLKQLHSQLFILKWSLRQLQSGYVVSKLEYTGELYEAFNGLVDQVAAASTQQSKNVVSNTHTSFNSWRYHQILQALNMLHILVLEVDSNGRVVYANRLAKEKLGEIEYITSEHIENKVLEAIAKLNKEGNNFPLHQEIYENSSGTWYRITSDRFLLPNGLALYIYIIEDVSEWKANEYQLTLSATMDAMTAAYNRKAGVEELEKILACTDPSEMYCIAFIDIDNLKTINDTYGHCEGDYTIKSIANVLLSSVRESDIVCRYGGDEFLIIFKNSSEELAEKIITRMYEELKRIGRKNPKPYILSFSYGIASCSNCNNSDFKGADLLRLADQKMYRYKTQKKKEMLKVVPNSQ